MQIIANQRIKASIFTSETQGDLEFDATPFLGQLTFDQLLPFASDCAGTQASEHALSNLIMDTTSSEYAPVRDIVGRCDNSKTEYFTIALSPDAVRAYLRAKIDAAEAE